MAPSSDRPPIPKSINIARRLRGSPIISLATLLLLAACQQQTTPTENVDKTLPEPRPARLSGELSYPSDHIPDDMRVCAEEATESLTLCNAQITPQGRGKRYVLEVPAGRYRVYAETRDLPGYRAYYTDAVTCGLQAGCDSHRPIVVTVAAGETQSDVNPQDWYAPDAGRQAAPSGPAPPAVTTPDRWTPAEAALIEIWQTLNSQCRGGSGDAEATQVACRDREAAMQDLDDADICYGREGEYGAQMEIHRCGPDSLR